MDLLAREMVHDLMLLEKQFCRSYMDASLIASNETLRSDLRRFQGDVFQLHTRFLTEMQQRGWLKTRTAGKQAIESAVITWEQETVRHPELGIGE
jgi:hypothetical protein